MTACQALFTCIWSWERKKQQHKPFLQYLLNWFAGLVRLISVWRGQCGQTSARHGLFSIWTDLCFLEIIVTCEWKCSLLSKSFVWIEGFCNMCGHVLIQFGYLTKFDKKISIISFIITFFFLCLKSFNAEFFHLLYNSYIFNCSTRERFT